jgi:hypothetical protein
VTKSFYDYSLENTDLIQLYQLSVENYGDSLFIHPPVFVYSLYFLKQWLHIPLPVSIILFHSLTLISLFFLTIALLTLPNSSTSYTRSQACMAGLWAVLIYAFCPFTSFSSQKIWIDNIAVLTVTLSALCHVLCTSLQRNSFLFLSGIFFGLFSLNSKITCLGLLPFLSLWTCCHSLRSQLPLQKIVWQMCSFFGGIIVGFAPWSITYYVSSFPSLLPDLSSPLSLSFTQIGFSQTLGHQLR